MLKQFFWQQGNRVSCEKRSKESENLLNQLIDLFFGYLSVKQIVILKKIGFCLIIIINFYLFFINFGFQICMGFNILVDFMVFVYRSTKNETIFRIFILFKILNFFYRFRLVIVCRFVRDGYTFRFQYYFIEYSVMKVISSVFSNVKVYYDLWLLGGKYGWFYRYKLS